MSDLIGRSALIAKIENDIKDTEKVVAELEEERERNLNGWKDATNIFALTKYGHGFSAYVKAIDILKRGGTDLGYNPYQE